MLVAVIGPVHANAPGPWAFLVPRNPGRSWPLGAHRAPAPALAPPRDPGPPGLEACQSSQAILVGPGLRTNAQGCSLQPRSSHPVGRKTWKELQRSVPSAQRVPQTEAPS